MVSYLTYIVDLFMMWMSILSHFCVFPWSF